MGFNELDATQALTPNLMQDMSYQVPFNATIIDFTANVAVTGNFQGSGIFFLGNWVMLYKRGSMPMTGTEVIPQPFAPIASLSLPISVFSPGPFSFVNGDHAAVGVNLSKGDLLAFVATRSSFGTMEITQLSFEGTLQFI